MSEREKTVEDATLAMAAIKLLCEKMEAHLSNQELSDHQKNGRCQVLHHQIREIAEEWA